MKSDRWMPLNVGDYLRDTGHLTAIEHGAYLLLIMAAWTRGGVLPADDEHLRRLARTDRKAWGKMRETVLAFFIPGDEGWRHKRVDAELERAATLTRKRSQLGKVGAHNRWKKVNENNGEGMAIAMALPSVCHAPIPLPIPLPNKKHTPPSIPPSVSPPDAKRGTRLPEGWQPSEDDARFARSLNLDPDAVAASFRDYWHDRTGKDATKRTWSGTWRNWCRREAERGGNRVQRVETAGRRAQSMALFAGETEIDE